MKLSVCLNAATGTLSKPDAMRLAHKLGYPAVECWEGKNLSDDEINEYKAILDETGMALACIGIAGGLVDPATRPDFLASVTASLAVAKRLGAKGVIVTTGDELAGVCREAQRQSVVDGLKEAAKIVAGSGIVLLLEPLNILVNHKGYYLARSDEAFGIVKEVNSPDIKVLFDIYHQQITEGNLIANIVDNIGLIGHFHVAGNPGRNEPYRGEINYKEVFDAIKKAGYTGYAGLEYWPKDDMEESLKNCLALNAG
jgi:hydroxypyruvate isomerase